LVAGQRGDGSVVEIEMSDSQQNTTPKKRPRWAKGFLTVLRESGNVRLASESVGIERSTAYDFRNSDDVFAAEWERAQDDAADLLEQEARRRAHDGWEEPVFGSLGNNRGSGEIGTVRKYSDTLLIFLLKGAKPEKYRERNQTEHTGSVAIKVEYGTDRSSS
jgi:hypothetical protein